MPDEVLITPEAFKEKFLDVAKERETQIIELGKEDKNYTELMLKNDGIIANVAFHLGLEYYREYWTIDAIYYRRKHNKYFSSRATYAEYLSVAIEHENLAHTAHVEINKLSLFNCPLKVLITYPLNEKNAMALLDEYSDILVKADIFKDFADNRKQLVIFGYFEDEKVHWKFHVYRGDGFTRI